MLITVTNQLSKVSNFNEAERQALEEALTVISPTVDFATGEHEVRNFYALDEQGHFLFGTGLLSYVANYLTMCGFVPAYLDERTQPTFVNQYPDARHEFVPYVDQDMTVDTMLQHGRGVCHLATNYGKTYVISQTLWKLNMPAALITVPTQALLYQTAADIEANFGLPYGSVGRVGDGETDWKPITVAVSNSAHTWVKERGQFPYDFQALIVDEGHMGVGEMHQQIALATDAYYRFWLSGTAYKKEDVFHEFILTALAGPMLVRYDNKWLVDHGRSIQPYIYFIDNKLDRSSLSDYGSDYQDQYHALKKDQQRNELVGLLHKLGLQHGMTCVTFVEHKNHYNMLEPYLYGTDTLFVKGGSTSYNEKVKRGLKDGTIKSVVSTSTWRQGVSIPNIDLLCNATGRKAAHSRDQIFGRLLRMSPLGYGLYFDFMDRAITIPARHAKYRLLTMQEHGFPIDIIKPEAVAGVFNGNFQAASVGQAMIKS